MESRGSDALKELCREIVLEFVAILDEAPALDDPADLEHLAATMLIVLEQPEVPPQAAFAVVDAIYARRDAAAAGLLAAVGVLAREPLAARARACGQRLADEGISSRAASRVGTLAVREAVRIDSPGAELLVVLLGRPRARKVQAAVLGVEHHDTGGALVGCALTPPATLGEARELLQGIDGADAPVQITAEDLTARVIAAASHAVDAQVAIGHEAGPALAIVSRALTGDPHGLPRPVVRAPWEDDDEDLIVDPAADADGSRRVVEMLLDELEQHVRAVHPPDDVVWQHVDLVASSMLQWKAEYGDGRLGCWTEEDLDECLLGYFPSKVSIEQEALPAVPDCASAFLEFLDARGSLSGEPLEQLQEACEELRDEFRGHAQDRSGWGPAKAIVMQMLAEGIDPAAPGAMDAWIADFNARPYEQRDAIVGPALDRVTNAQRSPGPRAQRRKAQRTARKRNRR